MKCNIKKSCQYWLLLLFTNAFFLIFLSCNDDIIDNTNYNIILTEDGKSLQVRKDTLLFLSRDSFSTIRDDAIDPNNIEILNRFVDVKRDNDWLKTKFGNWCLKYSLSPDSLYLCRKEYYYNCIPGKEGYVAIPYVPLGSAMGLYENDDNTIIIGYKGGINITPIKGVIGNCWTLIYYIGYTSNGRKIDLYFPTNPQMLKWYYSWYKIIN